MKRHSRFGGTNSVLSALDSETVNSVDFEDGLQLNLQGFEKKLHKIQINFDRIVKCMKPFLLDHAVEFVKE